MLGLLLSKIFVRQIFHGFSTMNLSHLHQTLHRWLKNLRELLHFCFELFEIMFLYLFKICIPFKNMFLFHCLELGSIYIFSHNRVNVLSIFIWCKFRNAFSISSNELKISYLYSYISLILKMFLPFIHSGDEILILFQD